MRTLRAPVLALLLALGPATGCSGDAGCTGHAYHPDLGQAGAKTPIQALETWLGTHEGFDGQPPDRGWIVEDTGAKDPATVVLTNDEGDGWWVSAVRTDTGGYVVAEATDDATGCGDELS